MSETGQIPDSIPRSFFVCNGGGPVKSQYLTKTQFRLGNYPRTITDWQLLREGSELGPDPLTKESPEISRHNVLVSKRYAANFTA